jgi:hypothetical protein
MSSKAAAVSVSVLSRKSNATEEFDELILSYLSAK